MRFKISSWRTNNGSTNRNVGGFSIIFFVTAHYNLVQVFCNEATQM